MHFQSTWKKEYRKKVILKENLQSKVDSIKKNNKTIATLNGSFDLLHAGHLQMIYEASLQADILIVALNSDKSIKGYKGENRPIVPLESRMQMMSAFYFVDYVTYFDELDPREILSIIDPDVHVNGIEYTKDCIEKEVVKKIHLVDFIPGFSTSTLIEKVFDAYHSKA